MKLLNWQRMVFATLLLALAAPLSAGDDKKDKKNLKPVYPAAVFPFEERGDDVKGLGRKVSDLLTAELLARPEMFLVDREDLKQVLAEQELNLSGIVRVDEAVRVGQLTGAKILVTGSVLQIGGKLYLVAKIIGTETSRVLGASAKGDLGDELDPLVALLADDVADTIAKRADRLVAKPISRDDRIAALKEKIGNRRRPTVRVEVSERHVGQAARDPAAETELMLFCDKLGFPVVDADSPAAAADVLITGEGISEFAARKGNLISVKARLEVKAVDRRTGRVLGVDRQTIVGVDLSEQIAAKTALQKAAARVAERLLPKLVSGAQD